MTRGEARAAVTLGDPRWRAVEERDAKADGEFFYAVKTTGVYCHPSCGARRARPENVSFHATTAAAEQAGFRPCKRCKPTEGSAAQRNVKLAEELCRLIEKSEAAPSLDILAANVRLSPFHVHRLFKAVMGLTPSAYARTHRGRRVHAALAEEGTVTKAIYGAGYNSGGRFYEEANDLLGMTPTAFRKGGAGLEIRFAVGECSLGSILVAATSRGVCAILLGDDPEELTHDLERRFQRAELVGGDAAFEAWVATAISLVEKPALGASLPLDIRGTSFQARVWEVLRAVPAGTTTTYTEIAQNLGAPKSVRAVARACAANPLAVVIPCHRVVRRDGALAGYRWGIERKRALLEREGSRLVKKD